MRTVPWRARGGAGGERLDRSAGSAARSERRSGGVRRRGGRPRGEGRGGRAQEAGGKKEKGEEKDIIVREKKAKR